jgi:hypothetical protein
MALNELKSGPPFRIVYGPDHPGNRLAASHRVVTTQMNKSFLLLFFKKEGLPAFV